MKRALLMCLLLACTRSKEPTADTAPSACHSGKWTEMEIAPLPQGTTRTLPELDTTCNADSDCTVTTEEVQDDAPRTYACCSGCTQRAVNAAWLTRFRAACTASPAPMCPPIGCAAMSAKAACRAHTCELATK